MNQGVEVSTERNQVGPVMQPVPWDLDALDADTLAAAYEELAEFVDRLVAADIDVPACWYVHGWVVHRLIALARWRREAHAPPASARNAAEWWAVGLASLIHEWQPLHGHRKGHSPIGRPWEDCVPTPPFGETVASRIRARREAPR